MSSNPVPSNYWVAHNRPNTGLSPPTPLQLRHFIHMPQKLCSLFGSAWYGRIISCLLDVCNLGVKTQVTWSGITERQFKETPHQKRRPKTTAVTSVVSICVHLGWQVHASASSILGLEWFTGVLMLSWKNWLLSCASQLLKGCDLCFGQSSIVHISASKLKKSKQKALDSFGMLWKSKASCLALNLLNTIIPPASIAKKPWETLVMQIGSLGSRPTNTGHENTRQAAPLSLQTSSSEQGNGRSWRRVTPAGTFHDQRRPGLGLLLLLREMLSCFESGQLRNKQSEPDCWYYLTCSKDRGQGCRNALSWQFACLQSMLNAKIRYYKGESLICRPC